MNPARLKAIADAQTGIAKKVLASVPTQHNWTTSQIISDMARSGSRPDPQIVTGCLDHLCDAGLIRERPQGRFQRIPIKEKDVPVTTQSEVKQDPSSKLERAAVALRALATELEDIALEIEEQHSGSDKELAKLRQLRDVLKTL